MSAGLTTPVLRDALQRVCVRMEAVADELNALDAAFGDGDLGVTMVRGARATVAELPTLPDDLGLAFLACAQAFTKTSGSTFGTLMATGLMSAAKATKGRSAVAWTEVPRLLEGALASMAGRGKAQLGDKTVLDALDALRRATEGLDDPAAMLDAARLEVDKAIETIRRQPARQGRARIFADKTVGKDDPGMIVVQRMLQGLSD